MVGRELLSCEQVITLVGGFGSGVGTGLSMIVNEDVYNKCGRSLNAGLRGRVRSPAGYVSRNKRTRRYLVLDAGRGLQVSGLPGGQLLVAFGNPGVLNWPPWEPPAC